MVALLAIPIKCYNIPQKQLDWPRPNNLEILTKVLWRGLQPLTFKQNHSGKCGNHSIACADGKFNFWKLLLAAWLVDCPEYSNLYNHKRPVRFWCEYRKNELQDYVHSGMHHHWHHQNLSRILSDTNRNKLPV
jgi:hypothetical protein